MVNIIYPALVAIIGLLIYLIANNAKAQYVGDKLFWIGLFWTVYLLANTKVNIP